MSKVNEPDVLKAKLSKKIAELSTVIQVLFVRNHEKGLELSATKKFYEEQLKLVVDEGKSKLNWLEKQLDDLERFRTLLEMKTEECERTKATVETIQEKQLETEKKMKERGVMLSDALAEIENLKKEISNRSPEELENLKRKNGELTDKLTEETTNLHAQKELVKDLEIKLNTIESNLNGMLSENNKLRSECSRLQEELTSATDEIKTLTQSLQETRRHGERALQRTRKLEESNRQIIAEKTLLERSNEQLNEEVNKLLTEQKFRDKTLVTRHIGTLAPKPIEITAPLKGKSHPPPLQKDDEIQFLKREIEKYRLELMNREVNFNRVFAEKNPLIITKPPEITAEELRLRNLTGLVDNKKNFTSFPSVLSDSKRTYGFHANRTRR